jgi:DNA-binding PadR family transcriptional regulator
VLTMRRDYYYLCNSFPALYERLERNNRRARFYTISASGRKRLASERQDFERMIAAIQKVLQTA